MTVDFEHSIFTQALRGGRRHKVARFILTVSRELFQDHSREELTDVTPEEAIVHPTWKMDQVTTINSSTSASKGLELIEAALFYDVDLNDIVVMVYLQSITYSMMEFTDGSTLAQASPPDM